MAGFRWGQAFWIFLWGCDVAALVVAVVTGIRAQSSAHRNRLKIAVWMTLWVEPKAFSGDAARYRQWSNRATVLFLALWLILWAAGPALGL